MRAVKNIVTIGGGSGTPIINEALLFAGAKKVTSIVTVMDSGGVTGRMRTDARGQEIAYSDGLRTLLSLIPPRSQKTQKVTSLRELLKKRNDRGQDLGYTIFSHFFDPSSGFAQIQEIFEKLTGTKFCGKVLPVTTNSSQLVFITNSGQIYKGEHELDDKRMSEDEVADIWLEPEVAGFSKAIEAIMEADLIVFACGSLHGSVIANLLPKGIKQALKISRGLKVLVTNLASTRNETHDFTPKGFIRIFDRYTGIPNFLDLLIIPQLTRSEFEKKYPEVAARYRLDHSYFLGWDDTQGVAVIKHDAVTVDPALQRIRHDPKKLAAVFRQLLK